MCVTCAKGALCHRLWASTTIGLVYQAYSFSHVPARHVPQAESGVTSHGHDNTAATQEPNEFVPLSRVQNVVVVNRVLHATLHSDDSQHHVRWSVHFKKAPSLDIITRSIVIAFLLF